MDYELKTNNGTYIVACDSSYKICSVILGVLKLYPYIVKTMTAQYCMATTGL